MSIVTITIGVKLNIKKKKTSPKIKRYDTPDALLAFRYMVLSNCFLINTFVITNESRVFRSVFKVTYC